MELRRLVCHDAPMATRSTKAGGFFLTFCILGGLGAGLAAGDPMRGVVIGTMAGIALAVLLWLIDRRRAR